MQHRMGPIRAPYQTLWRDRDQGARWRDGISVGRPGGRNVIGVRQFYPAPAVIQETQERPESGCRDRLVAFDTAHLLNHHFAGQRAQSMLGFKTFYNARKIFKSPLLMTLVACSG